MKKLSVLIFLLFSFNSFSQWENSYETAQKIALSTNRFLLVDFFANWCGPCKEMDKNSWSNEEVKLLTQDFVLLKVDIDFNKDLANKYSVSSIPNIFILDGNGKKLISFLGYQSPGELKNTLSKYLLSTEYLAYDLINVFKSDNFPNTLRLVQKYYDYSLFVNQNIKYDVVNLGGLYLYDLERKLNKKDLNYGENIQKLELIKLYDLAYNFKYKKLDDKLNKKFKNENLILENNKSFYFFLKYISLKGMKSTDLDVFRNKLLESEDNKFVVEKAENIIKKDI